MVCGLERFLGLKLSCGKGRNNFYQIDIMAKIQNLEEPWDGLHSGDEIEEFLKEKLGKMVEQENGKGLSTNNFDNDYKRKVDAAPLSVGYFECSTEAATSLKSVTAIGYALQNGGSIKIKMKNANSASSPTLNINLTGSKPLYYNGEIASASNTWEDGEVISVYYDNINERYCATNFQGGGGNADKIKYDNQQSGIQATTAQGAIDELKRELTELVVGGITLSASVPSGNVIEADTNASVTIRGTASKAIDSLSVTYNGSSQTAQGTSVQKSISVNLGKGTYNFTVSGTHKNIAISSVTGHFSATYRTYVGAGTDAAGVVSGGQNVLTLSLSSALYNVSFGTDQYLFIVTPLTLKTIKDETGMEVEFQTLSNYNTNWKVYRSKYKMKNSTTIKFYITAN